LKLIGKYTIILIVILFGMAN